MKSWQGQSCRKTVRHLELELELALTGKAIDRNGNDQSRGVLPRPIKEIYADLATWRSRLAGPEPKLAPPVEAPDCRRCGKKLRPEFDVVSRRVETHEGHHTVDEPGALRGFGYNGRGYFCSLRCGWGFAVELLEGLRS